MKILKTILIAAICLFMTNANVFAQANSGCNIQGEFYKSSISDEGRVYANFGIGTDGYNSEEPVYLQFTVRRAADNFAVYSNAIFVSPADTVQTFSQPVGILDPGRYDLYLSTPLLNCEYGDDLGSSRIIVDEITCQVNLQEVDASISAGECTPDNLRSITATVSGPCLQGVEVAILGPNEDSDFTTLDVFEIETNETFFEIERLYQGYRNDGQDMFGFAVQVTHPNIVNDVVFASVGVEECDSENITPGVYITDLDCPNATRDVLVEVVGGTPNTTAYLCLRPNSIHFTFPCSYFYSGFVTLDASGYYADTLSFSSFISGDAYDVTFFDPAGAMRTDLDFGPSCIQGKVATDEGIDVRVFPNPASQRISVAFNQGELIQEVIIELLNMQGQLVQSLESTNGELTNLNIGNIPNGMYLLRVQLGGGGTVVKKIEILN